MSPCQQECRQEGPGSKQNFAGAHQLSAGRGAAPQWPHCHRGLGPGSLPHSQPSLGGARWAHHLLPRGLGFRPCPPAVPPSRRTEESPAQAMESPVALFAQGEPRAQSKCPPHFITLLLGLQTQAGTQALVGPERALRVLGEETGCWLGLPVHRGGGKGRAYPGKPLVSVAFRPWVRQRWVGPGPQPGGLHSPPRLPCPLVFQEGL